MGQTIIEKIMAAHTGLKRQAVYTLLEGMGKEN